MEATLLSKAQWDYDMTLLPSQVLSAHFHTGLIRNGILIRCGLDAPLLAQHWNVWKRAITKYFMFPNRWLGLVIGAWQPDCPEA
jgi:hypothetical protein